MGEERNPGRQRGRNRRKGSKKGEEERKEERGEGEHGEEGTGRRQENVRRGRRERRRRKGRRRGKKEEEEGAQEGVMGKQAWGGEKAGTVGRARREEKEDCGRGWGEGEAGKQGSLLLSKGFAWFCPQRRHGYGPLDNEVAMAITRNVLSMVTFLIHNYEDTGSSETTLLILYPAWPLVDGALFVSKRRALPQTVC